LEAEEDYILPSSPNILGWSN